MLRSLLFATGCLAVLVSPVLAAKRGFSIPVGGILINNSASYGAAGVAGTSIQLLPNASTKARFTVNYVLPPDYQPGTTVKLRLHLSSQEVTACSAVLKPATGYRMRPGQPVVNFDALSDNVAPAGGSLAVAFANMVGGSQVLAVKTFTIKGPKSAPFTGQKPGDGLTLVFERQPEDPADTCPGSITLRQVDVIYRAN